MIHEHTITLKGAAVEGAGLSGHVLRDLFAVLVQGAEQSLRYRLEGRSTARGSSPSWLRSASDFQMLEISRGAHERTLHLEAASLVDSMPDKFAQATMFDDLDPRRSPLELFEDALDDALAERVDSEAFDQPLLETCASFRSVLGAGIDSVEIKNGRSVRIDGDSLERVIRLSRVAHAQRKVRLAGRLDLIRYSDCRFTLVLENGVRIAGAGRELGTEALRDAFGTNVIVTGTAEFRPSGRLLRVDADLVEPATDNELKLFASIPRPLLAASPPERQEERGGLGALLGQWPGDESVEQLIAQLGQLA